MSTLMQEEKRVRTVFLLDLSERAALEQLSLETGAPLAELLRRSVQAWLSTQAERGHAVN